MIVLQSHIDQFFRRVATGEVRIYNEFSLQHELGIHLRSAVSDDFRVEFERPTSYFGIAEKLEKREIDISVFDSPTGHREAVELKFPRSGQYPEQMFKSCQDFRFIEQLADHGFHGGAVVMVADDPLFYDSRNDTGIYRYFRSGETLSGVVKKPTGKKDASISLRGTYRFRWIPIKGRLKYFAVGIGPSQARDPK